MVSLFWVLCSRWFVLVFGILGLGLFWVRCGDWFGLVVGLISKLFVLWIVVIWFWFGCLVWFETGGLGVGVLCLV